MLSQKKLKVATIAAGILFLGACTTVETTETAPNATASSVTSTEVSVKTTEAPVTAEKVSEAESDGSRKICKSTTVVGSKFRRKVCATADEWAKREKVDQKTTGDIQRRGGSPGVTN